MLNGIWAIGPYLGLSPSIHKQVYGATPWVLSQWFPQYFSVLWEHSPRPFSCLKIMALVTPFFYILPYLGPCGSKTKQNKNEEEKERRKERMKMRKREKDNGHWPHLLRTMALLNRKVSLWDFDSRWLPLPLSLQPLPSVLPLQLCPGGWSMRGMEKTKKKKWGIFAFRALRFPFFVAWKAFSGAFPVLTTFFFWYVKFRLGIWGRVERINSLLLQCTLNSSLLPQSAYTNNFQSFQILLHAYYTDFKALLIGKDRVKCVSPIFSSSRTWILLF